MNPSAITSIFEGVFGKGNVIYDASEKDFQTGKGVFYYRINKYSKTGDILRIDGAIYREIPDNKSDLSLFDFLQERKAIFGFTASDINNNESFESVEFTVLLEDEKQIKEFIEKIDITANGSMFSVVKDFIKKLRGKK